MKHDLSHGKIIVTGAAGFIGSALIWELNRRGYTNIIAVDMLGQDDKFKNLVPLQFEDYVEADILIKNVMSQDNSLGQAVHTVFHLGACSSTTENNGRYLIENNYEYTKLLAGWTLHHDARFVYASSAATYGDGAQGMDDKDLDIQKLRPLNMYGYSKQLFDLYAQGSGMHEHIAGLKYFNVFGPNEKHKDDMRSMVNKAFDQINTTGAISLFKSEHPDYKDGEQMRDFLYVKDAVNMTLHLAENRVANGLFNLGSGEAHTWLELVRPIFEVMGKDEQIHFIDMPKELKAKYQYYTKADISKLREAGYTAEITPLADAVKDYVGNYLLPGKHLGDEA